MYIPTIPPIIMVEIGITIIFTGVRLFTNFDISAPTNAAMVAPTGSPIFNTAIPKSLNEIVLLPIIPQIIHEKIPSAGAPSECATPAPMAAPIQYCAICPSVIRIVNPVSVPICFRISPIISDENSPRAIPFITLIR